MEHLRPGPENPNPENPNPENPIPQTSSPLPSRPIAPNHVSRSLVAILCLALGSLAGCKQKTSSADTTSSINPDTTLSSNPDTTSHPAPIPHKHIYSEDANPNTDIAAALEQARSQHKRVLLDFGGNWCGDCQVLDLYFHQTPNLDLLTKNFVLVHIDIGRMDKNLSVAEKYSVPVSRGVPALAVLDSNGKLLFSQQNKEFENMRAMNASSVTQFLNQWKA